jgi:hypothetical protein
MGLTITVPVKSLLEEKETVCEIVEKTLKNDPENAYTLAGLLITSFDVKESEIKGKSFSQWRKGLPAKYVKVKSCLNKLVEEKKVNQRKRGRAVVYWWAEK